MSVLAAHIAAELESRAKQVLVGGKPVVLLAVRKSELMEQKLANVKFLEAALDLLKMDWDELETSRIAQHRFDCDELMDKLKTIAVEIADNILAGRFSPCEKSPGYAEQRVGRIVLEWFFGDDWVEKYQPLM